MAIRIVQHLTNPNKTPKRREEKKIPGEYTRVHAERKAAAAAALAARPVLTKRAVQNKVHYIPEGSGVMVFANGTAYYDVSPLQAIELYNGKAKKVASAAQEFISTTNPNVFSVKSQDSQRWFMLATPYVAAGRFQLGGIDNSGKVIQLRLDPFNRPPIIMNTEGYLNCDLVCLVEIEFGEDGSLMPKNQNIVFSDTSLSFFDEVPLSKSGMIISKDGKSYQNWREKPHSINGNAILEEFEPDL